MLSAATDRSDSTLPDAPVDTAALAAATPSGQAARLQALRDYDILDTPVEAAFEDITRIASQVCGTPIAVVNLIDECRQWFKSEIGLGVRETPLDTSICAHAILQHDFFEVPDTTLDSRFSANPLVTGDPNLRFYAGALLKTPDGHPLGTICVLDTKPRKLDEAQRGVLRALARQTMAQLELRRALVTVQRTRDYRSRLMAVAGHDLRQPLSVIMVVLDQMRRDGALVDAEQLALAVEAAETLDQDLTRLARAAREDDAPTPQRVDAEGLLMAVSDRWRYVATRKGLEFAVDDCDIALLSDPRMLTGVLDNLVGNAIKYTVRGSVRLRCIEHDDHLRFEVIDTGCGIAPELLDDIFEAFSQLDVHSEGLGLGLSIVRRTAEVLDHRLRVSSQVGCGSTFSIEVPRA